MEVVFLKTFEKDLGKVDRTVRRRLLRVVEELEGADGLAVIQHVKRLAGIRDAYRLRIGSYRLGFFLVGDTVQLARLLHRKDIYRFFP